MKKLKSFNLLLFYLFVCCMLMYEYNGDEGSFFKEESNYCHGDDCTKQGETEGKDAGSGLSESPSQSAPVDEISVMITFYNAIHNIKLQKTFTVTVSSLLKHASVPLVLYIIGDEQSQDLASNIISQHSQNKSYSVSIDQIYVIRQKCFLFL